MISKKDRYASIVHAAASVMMTIVLIYMIAGVFIRNAGFAMGNLLLYAALLAYCGLNILVSQQLNSEKASPHRAIALQFAVKAIPAAVLAVASMLDQPNYFSAAMLGMTAAMEAKIAWDYWKYRNPERLSKFILGLFGFAQIILALLFVMVFIEDETADYPAIIMPVASAVCYICLLIRSFGSKKEEAV